MPRRPRVISTLQSGEIANHTLVNALHGLAHAVMIAPAQAGDDGQVLLLGLFAGGQHGADARRIDGDRLLGEDVLARIHRCLEVHGPEVRRRRQQHHVYKRDHLLVSVEAGETAVWLDLDSAGYGLVPLELIQTRLQAIREHVAHGDQLGVLVGGQRLLGCAGSAVAATDQADAEDVAPGRVNGRSQRSQRRAGCRDSRSCQEIASRCARR